MPEYTERFFTVHGLDDRQGTARFEDGVISVNWPCGDGISVTADALRSAIETLKVLERFPDTWLFVVTADGDEGVFARVEEDRLFVCYGIDEALSDRRNDPANWDEFQKAATEILGVAEAAR